jgi:hypothetical protein
MMFDELVDLDEERLTAVEMLARQKERVAKVYNRKVKEKNIIVDDYVWKVILPIVAPRKNGDTTSKRSAMARSQ